MSIPIDTSLTLRVPASSANLGPGFDCLGLALGIWDEATVTVVAEPGLVIDVQGAGAQVVPRDESHLIYRSMVTAWRRLGTAVPTGLHLRTHNAVPHGQGLGSSATAIVMGVAAAQALSTIPRAGSAAQSRLDLATINEIACALEGHPDNASASVYGGATLSVTDLAHSGSSTRTVPLRLDPRIVPVALLPQTTLSTHTARSVLPDVVPLASAAANSARVGLLVHALTAAPDLLLAGTADVLHQEPRRPSYPQSMALVDALRAQGVAAAISGAGPSVLVLATAEQVPLISTIADAELDGPSDRPWQMVAPAVPEHGVHLVREADHRGAEIALGQ